MNINGVKLSHGIISTIYFTLNDNIDERDTLLSSSASSDMKQVSMINTPNLFIMKLLGKAMHGSIYIQKERVE